MQNLHHFLKRQIQHVSFKLVFLVLPSQTLMGSSEVFAMFLETCKVFLRGKDRRGCGGKGCV